MRYIEVKTLSYVKFNVFLQEGTSYYYSFRVDDLESKYAQVGLFQFALI